MTFLFSLFVIGMTVFLQGQALAQRKDTTMTAEQIDAILDRVIIDNDIHYYIRLLNGDILTGSILMIEEGSEPALRIQAKIGRAMIFVREIAYISEYAKAYRHNHRYYIMPTAIPIHNNHFVGLWEILFLYGGFGVSDVFSMTAGRSFVPGLASDEQLSTFNAKFTISETQNGLVEGGKEYWAVGAQGSWLGAENFVGNIYAVATFTGRRTSVSTIFFAKVGGPDFYIASGSTLFSPFKVNYSSGTMGAGIGLDSRIPGMHDMYFIGELWNNDLTRPANTALLLGVRLSNSTLSMDFGFTLFSQPTVVPVVSVALTPW